MQMFFLYPSATSLFSRISAPQFPVTAAAHTSSQLNCHLLFGLFLHCDLKSAIRQKAGSAMGLTSIITIPH